MVGHQHSLFKRLAGLLQKEDFRQHPAKAIFKRLYWRVHWKLREGKPFIYPFYGGMMIRLANSSASYGIFLNAGFSDRQVADLFISFLRPGMVVFDCGAHIGEYTLLFSHLIGSEGKVYAFEPDPRLFPYLEENIRINALKQAVQNAVAVGDGEGEVPFNLSPDPTGSFVVARSRNGTQTTKVSMISLDEYVYERRLARVDAIKIDVEGSELAVLQGALSLLRRRIPALLFIECHSHEDEWPITKLLTECGYEVTRIERNGLYSHFVART